jgi:tRNA A37 N6-isopentenylltransferase MiaA
MAETIEQVKVRTRQFARRQLTWFRGLSECHDVPVESETDSPSDASEIAERIVAMADCS